ncbi:MAG TPA: glycosyltransferase family 4 protein [Leptolyngbyaceae cyanobacterium M33_DOE_097]|nr:glycosyltransferase family 4 protein [Leptolyngbyaceae cyanobacterium M33_DOE_097]
MRIVYAAGPGNVIGTFEHWKKGEDDPSQVAVTYSGQFFDVCSALNATGYVITSNSEKKVFKEGNFTIENRPVYLSRKSGILYYIGQVLYELNFILTVLRFRADLVVGNLTACFFVLSLLPLVGVQVIPTLHCVLWPKYAPISKARKLFWQLNRRFFSKDCLAILSLSADVNEQVEEITHHQARPIVNFLSTYRRTEFANITPASQARSPFHVLFAGRLEADKGVFDLLEVAKRFQADGCTDIVFHLCGTGTKLDLLREQVREFGLEASFVLHGYCKKAEMQQMYSLSHVVIVPTRSDFIEGLNKVVIEGVLANRPVITSSVCPALVYVREAVVEVPPDDFGAYGDAILKLYSDRAFYQQKQQSCQQLQEQFYSDSRSWGKALMSILKET